MAGRDYAKKPTNKRRPPARKGAPGWVWMLGGLAVGLFVAFLVYLQQQPGTVKGVKREAAVQPLARPQPAPAKRQEADEEEDGIDFDFYRLLPSYEVAIPEQELQQPLAKGRKASDYLLQTGSFRNPRDADARKAQLALLGINSKIHTIKANDGSTWHRVVVGPYDTTLKLDRVRRRLQDNHIDYLTVRKQRNDE